MRWLSTRSHGVLDYMMGVLLAVVPFAYRFPTAWATLLPVALGVGTILYSLATDYELGAFPLIGMRTHLVLDASGGLLLAASPWLFGFASLMWAPHACLGAIEVAAALATQTRPAHGPIGSAPATTR